MKKMAKILTALLSAVCLSFGVGCAAFAEIFGPRYNHHEPYSAATFTVGYDYGQIVEGKATLLLRDSSLFFDPEEYGVAPLIAGDEIHVRYNGEMLIQETYPSTVCLNGEIVDVIKSKSASLMGITFDGVTEGKIVTDGYTFVDLPEYVIEKDNSFTPLSEVEVGTTLFVACHFDREVDGQAKTWKPTAIYTYSFDYPLLAKEVTPWAAELSADEIIEIEQKSFNGSVGPNGFTYIRTTQDKVQIEKALRYFQMVLYREAREGEEEIDGGETVVYTLRTAEKEYVYSTYAGYYSNESGCYYPERQAPYIDADTINQFFMTSAECVLYVNGKAFKTYEQGLTEYLFKRSLEEPVSPTDKYVLECGSYRLYLLDERRFLLDHGGQEVPFILVGEKDFSEFFDDFAQSSEK